MASSSGRSLRMPCIPKRNPNFPACMPSIASSYIGAVFVCRKLDGSSDRVFGFFRNVVLPSNGTLQAVFKTGESYSREQQRTYETHDCVLQTSTLALTHRTYYSILYWLASRRHF